MYATHRHGDYAIDERPAGPRAAPDAPVRMKVEAVEPPSRYAGASNRPLILLIALAHVAAIVALVKLDVIHVAAKRPDPVLIMLRPLAEAPPPQAQPKQAVAPPKVDTPIVAPPPIVATPAAPPPVAAAPAAPPRQAAPAVVAAPSPSPIAAPIVPPDGSAATLGNPSPRYPFQSRRAHEEGTVRLRVLISPDGDVKEIGVARSSGYDRLDKAALETVRKWRFRPGTQAGRAVEAVGYLSIPFVLDS